MWGLVNRASDEHTNLLKEVFTMFFSENALSPFAFPSLKKFESEVVSMTIDLLGGNRRACGSMTSGGTESILLAVKTYRDWARDKFPEIREPEMVLPGSIHPSFEKAAKYFDVKPIYVPVDNKTFGADVKAMKDNLSENTILIVGFMAQNTLGRRILELGQAYEQSARNGKAPVLKFLNKEYPLKARVINLGGFSAHADKRELLRFLKQSNLQIKKIALVHGEDEQTLSFAGDLKKEGFAVVVPRKGETVQI